MPSSWQPSASGVLTLPSGRTVRGRALGKPVPAGPLPDFGIYLLAEPPAGMPWSWVWVEWPDFRLPKHRGAARNAMAEVWQRAASERVEVGCLGGRGRTGTALACIAVLDGVPTAEAVAFVRANYDPRAVETPWQRRFVASFS